MSNDFDFYEGTATESAGTPKVTVRRGGILVLTRASVDMLGEDVTHVRVGYNPKTRSIGLRSASADEKGSYRLRSQKNTVSRLVDGKRVFALHGLKADKAQSFQAEDFGDGVVGFRLETDSATDAETKLEVPKSARAKRAVAAK